MAQMCTRMGTEQWNASETNSQKKKVQERREAMPANHHYEKGNDKLQLFCTQFFKSSTGKELSTEDFYH